MSTGDKTGVTCGPVWVVAEQVDGRIRTVSMQLVGHARKLADQLGTDVEVVLLGYNLDGVVQPVFAAGADRICLGDDFQLALYQPEIYTEMVVSLAVERGY